MYMYYILIIAIEHFSTPSDSIIGHPEIYAGQEKYVIVVLYC